MIFNDLDIVCHKCLTDNGYHPVVNMFPWTLKLCSNCKTESWCPNVWDFKLMKKWYQVTFVPLKNHPMIDAITGPLTVRVDFDQDGIQDKYAAELEALSYLKHPEFWNVLNCVVVTKDEK